MNYLVVSYISKLITPGALVFEYGSGASTLFWISKGCELVSIEHDRNFYEKLSGAVGNKCKYLLVEPEPNSEIAHKSHELPGNYKSSDFPEHSFESYVKTIEIYPDDYFDIVVIDGRARPSCLMHAKAKVKRSGILVLDNSDRDYYLKNTAYLFEGWLKEEFRGTVRGLLSKEQTTVFHKP